jgi:hypothetical protein
MAEPCLEIEGTVDEEPFDRSYSFKASVGKSGFALTFQIVSEPLPDPEGGEYWITQPTKQTKPIFIMGGEKGFVAALDRLPKDEIFLGHVSTANDVPETGPGCGGILYAMFGNYSQSIKPDTQISLPQMIVDFLDYPNQGRKMPTVRQTWRYDSVFPFGATNMTAYMLPDANYPTNSVNQLYPDGWKIGEMKVIQQDARTSIPTLVEAIYFRKLQSNSQRRSPDEVQPSVVERIKVTRITEGQRTSYLPEIKAKGQRVHDYRGKTPDGEVSRYWLRPGDSWPPSDGPEFARRQSESLEEWKARKKLERNPLWPTATMLIGSGVILAFVIRLSRQRSRQVTSQ